MYIQFVAEEWSSWRASSSLVGIYVCSFVYPPLLGQTIPVHRLDIAHADARRLLWLISIWRLHYVWLTKPTLITSSTYCSSYLDCDICISSLLPPRLQISLRLASDNLQFRIRDASRWSIIQNFKRVSKFRKVRNPCLTRKWNNPNRGHGRSNSNENAKRPVS